MRHLGAILVEDGDTAEGARVPFCVVLLEIRVDRLEEGSNEGCLQHRPNNGALVPDVLD